MSAADPSVLAVADDLYAEQLTRFTAARDARVKELKGTETAAEVKALRKPSLAAWVVNLLVRRDPDQVEQVLAVGESLREAQRSMSGADLRALTKQRRQLTAAVTAQARGLAADEGVRVTETVADQVETTLTAAMLDPECARAVRSGLLVTALAATGVGEAEVRSAVALPDALGFAATARETVAPAPPELRVVPDPEADAKARAAAETALARAETEVEAATSERDEAAELVEELEARTMQLQGESEELRRRLAELEESLEAVDEQVTDAEEARTDADSVLAEAVQARDRARAAVERLP